MKTLGILFILFSLANPQIGLANSDGSSKADPDPEKVEGIAYHTLGQQIHDHIKFPSFLMELEMSGSSKVKFKVNYDHTISVVEVYGNNSRINNYLKQQLDNKLVVVPNKQLGKTYEVNINFYLI